MWIIYDLNKNIFFVLLSHFVNKINKKNSKSIVVFFVIYTVTHESFSVDLVMS